MSPSTREVSRDEEITRLSSEHHQQELEIKQLKQEVDVSQRRIREMKSHINDLEHTEKTTKRVLEQERQDLKASRTEATNSSEEQQDANRHLHDMENLMKDQISRRKQLESDLQDSERARQKMEASLDDAKKKLESLKREGQERSQRAQEEHGQVLQLQDKLQNLNGQFQAQETVLHRTEDSLERAQQDRKMLNDELTTLKRELKEALLQNQHHASTRSELDTNLTSQATELEQKEAALNETKQALTEHRRLLLVTTNESESRQRDLKATEQRLEDQESAKTKLENELARVQESLETITRRKESLEKNLQEVNLSKEKAIEKSRNEMLELKAAYVDAQTGRDRENEQRVRTLKNDLVRHRKESDTLISSLSREKTDQLEHMRQTGLQLKAQLEQSKSESYTKNEELFLLNKKLRQTEKSQHDQLQQLSTAHEAEIGSLRFEFDEEHGRLKTDHQKAIDEFSKQLAAVQASNKEYTTRIPQLESRLIKQEQDYENEREATGKRFGELESGKESLTHRLSKLKETQQELINKLQDADRIRKEQEIIHRREMEDLRKLHGEVLNGEKVRLTTLMDRQVSLELEAEDLRSTRELAMEHKRDLKKAYSTNAALKAQLDSARSVLAAGLRELQSSTEPLKQA